ncbi:MAG: hypothetical protein CBB97_26000 [Candidatus Endolissoclinum sp. TMED37]|nr:MAG: hypothetical protein CBB97_26000 [Candidatus Endolissoclinum sp. TMED37]
MKIFFVTRLFTGFENSLKQSNWSPEGLPTIYKLIDELDKKNTLYLYFLAKDSGKTYSSGWNYKKDMKIALKELKAQTYVFAGINYFYSFIPKNFAMLLRDFRHLVLLIFLIRKNKPDLIYLDSSNVVIAAIIKIIFPKKNIVLRVLGICSFLRSIPNSKRIVNTVYKWAFKSHFSAVIGTQDGSGTEVWLNKLLNNNVKRYVLLNGVDKILKDNHLKKNYINIKRVNREKVLILFLGRLEASKGINFFLEAAFKTLKYYKKKIKFIVVGDGSLYQTIINKVNKNNMNYNFEFLRNIPHNEVMQLQSISDIYISTNTDGNLSNANLEAISANKCMIIPRKRHTENIDIETELLLKDAVLYYKNNDLASLIEKIKFLITSPKQIKRMSKKIQIRKKLFLKSWKERVDEEKNILYRLK